MSELRPFHLAIPVHDLKICRRFYSEFMQMEEGRSAEKWVDFNFYGHQFVIHETGQKANSMHNHVDGHGVPVPHFGVVLSMDDWVKLADHLRSMDIEFIIEPYIRLRGNLVSRLPCFFMIHLVMLWNLKLLIHWKNYSRNSIYLYIL